MPISTWTSQENGVYTIVIYISGYFSQWYWCRIDDQTNVSCFKNKIVLIRHYRPHILATTALSMVGLMLSLWFHWSRCTCGGKQNYLFFLILRKKFLFWDMSFYWNQNKLRPLKHHHLSKYCVVISTRGSSWKPTNIGSGVWLYFLPSSTITLKLLLIMRVWFLRL